MSTRVDLLHEKPNGVWSLTWAEVNKWVFFTAYKNRVDDTAIRRSLMESKAYLDRVTPRDEAATSPLLEKWNNHPPSTREEWSWWIAVHQQHLFLGPDRRGGFFLKFPATNARDQRSNYQLTKLFYERLLISISDLSS